MLSITKKAFEKISNKSNKFINDCFSLAFKIIKKKKLTNLLMDLYQKKLFRQKAFRYHRIYWPKI